MIADSRFWGFVVVVIMVMSSGVLCGVTEEQMTNTAKMMRDICQPKFKLSDDVANTIKTGNFPDDQNVKCYINCILEMMNSVKKGKMNYDSTMKSIDLLIPEHLKDSYRAGTEACKNSADGIKNNCDASAKLLMCFIANIPSFGFP